MEIATLIVSFFAIIISIWAVYQSPKVQSKVSKEWEREKLKHLVTADYCNLRERWMENFRNAIDEFVESAITIASIEADGGPSSKGIPPVDERKLYGRIESKYMRILMYFSPEESEVCKSIKSELDNILNHLKNNGHNVDLDYIRVRRTNW